MHDPQRTRPAREPAGVLRVGSRLRRIVLATDLTSASDSATNEALTLAAGLAADVLVVSIIDVPLPRAAGHTLRVDQHRAAREAAAQVIVARGRKLGIRVTFLVWAGEPGPAVVDAAESEQADLVVVGRGRTKSDDRDALGIVSDYVVRHARSPVLIVRN